MSNQKEIFRKVSLERLSSPEQLDQLMKVTGPRSWIALWGLIVILASTVVWSVVGSIPEQVQAQGILIKPGGVFDVFASATGTLADISVTAGGVVKKGQVVAHIEQPDMEKQIENTKAKLVEAQNQHKELSRYTRQDESLQGDARALQQANLQATITYAQDRLTALAQQIASEEALLQRGLITNQTVLQTRQTYFATNDQLDRAKNDLKQLAVNQLSTRTQKDNQVVQSQLAINELERNIAFMEDQLKNSSEVTSPYSGRILEVKARRGDIVGRGVPMASLQLDEQDVQGLQAVIYVPPQDGKKVERAMPVQLSPLTAPRQEFGFLMAKVTYVSEFPATREGLMNVLANETVVSGLMAAGAPFAVYADLEKAPGSASGYQWSSPKGAALTVNSGTPCFVTITVRKRRPIEMVIPLLKEYSGL